MKRTDLTRIVKSATSQGIRSIFFFPGFEPLGNRGSLLPLDRTVLRREDVESLIRDTASPWQYGKFLRDRELDYSFEVGGVGRFRLAAFMRTQEPSLVVRPIPAEVPGFETLGLPAVLRDLVRRKEGLILVTGPSGSGKSTTVAALIDAVNSDRSAHIVIVEEIVEFVHRPKRSIITQREVGTDTRSFEEALKRVLREDPDVVAVGDVYGPESMKALIEMAERGHLAIGVLHASSATEAIHRVIDIMPGHHHDRTRNSLARALLAVLSQRLVRRRDDRGLVGAFELMVANKTVRELIRQNKVQQIDSLLDMMRRDGSRSMNNSLHTLYQQGLIEQSEVIAHSCTDDRFAEKVLGERPAEQEGPAKGDRFLDVRRDTVVYRADFQRNISSFDSSGEIMQTPKGLLFRDNRRTSSGGGSFHFVADYSVLNGAHEAFALRSMVKLAYRIRKTYEACEGVHFQLRLQVDGKKTISLPEKPIPIAGDDQWHTLSIPVPANQRNKKIRYYMLMFDDAVEEIIFDDICFL